jgi:hypothetical protein
MTYATLEEEGDPRDGPYGGPRRFCTRSASGYLNQIHDEKRVYVSQHFYAALAGLTHDIVHNGKPM